MPVPGAGLFAQTFAQSTNTINSVISSGRSVKELNYKAFVSCQDQGILVEAWLPESVGADVHSEYDAPFAQGLGGDSRLAQLAKLSGISLTTQALSVQVWQGASYINFTLPFIFSAETSAETDVMRPIMDLMRLTMPTESSAGGLFKAPGPRLDPSKLIGGAKDTLVSIGGGLSENIDVIKRLTSDFTTSNAISSAEKSADNLLAPVSKAIVNSVVNNISLSLGKFLYFPSVVVTDISPQYDVIIGEDGNPMRATVNVEIGRAHV